MNFIESFISLLTHFEEFIYSLDAVYQLKYSFMILLCEIFCLELFTGRLTL